MEMDFLVLILKIPRFFFHQKPYTEDDTDYRRPTPPPATPTPPTEPLGTDPPPQPPPTQFGTAPTDSGVLMVKKLEIVDEHFTIQKKPTQEEEVD